MKHTREQLKTLQARSLQGKIQLTQTRIMEWYERYEGKVYISFSGGKDSTVLLDLARRMYPDIEAVFCDTGLEYPEVRAFAMSKENTTPIKPLKYDRKKRQYVPTNFIEIIQNFGYPVITKEVAKHVRDARKNLPSALKKFDENSEYIKKHGTRYSLKKWAYLIDSNIPISPHCCDCMKKDPAKQFEKARGKKCIVATMACESALRETHWLETGCNSFDGKRAMSRPMSFWTEQDVLQYLKITGIPYASVYGEIVPKDNQLSLIEDDSAPLCTTGYERTGCVFCMFGIMRDKKPNRFQRMKQTHPKLYEYCIGGGAYDENGMLKPDKHGLGIGKVLDFIGIQY